jgi:AcrR family transcriptional regulator
MNMSEHKETGWRGSADLWLDAAYEALLSGGVEAVKIMPLATRLGLSRTSFYWHFTDREALLAALIARTTAPAATITQAVLNLFDCWITPDLFDARLEFAIRNWAQTAPDLAQTLGAEDATRLEALRAMFLRHGYAPDQADIRARTIYLTQIGYIALRTDEDTALRVARMPTYVETFTGMPPTEAEVRAFAARHTDKL